MTDMTYAYRIFPTKLLQAIKWTELRHPSLFETVIKPLRLGIKVIRIPGVRRARTEGESQNTSLAISSISGLGCACAWPQPIICCARNDALKYAAMNRSSEHRL